MNMDLTAVILYQGALAHYEVDVREDGTCQAHLARYNGNKDHFPETNILLHKEGRHWVANISDQTLSDDLGYAIEIKAKPILEIRKRTGGHPAA